MNGQKFESEYGYSVVLPDNWSEYELENEKNTNGFFDTSEWTGNLLITPLVLDVHNLYDFVIRSLSDIDYKELLWNDFRVLHFLKDSNNIIIYFWYLIETDKAYICSFTIDSDNRESEQNQKELVKIEGILKSSKTK